MKLYKNEPVFYEDLFFWFYFNIFLQGRGFVFTEFIVCMLWFFCEFGLDWCSVHVKGFLLFFLF